MIGHELAPDLIIREENPDSAAGLITGLEVILLEVTPPEPINRSPSALDFYAHLIRLAQASKLQ